MGLWSNSRMREELTKAELIHEDEKFQPHDDRDLFDGVSVRADKKSDNLDWKADRPKLYRFLCLLRKARNKF